MEYSLHKAFVTYVTFIETFRELELYRAGAKIIRNGLPSLNRGDRGFRDVQTIKQFVETVLVEEDSIVELVCIDDAISTIEALSDESKQIYMTNPEEIKQKIFQR
ncbi:MAG: hypothetical protein ACXAD7_25175 [Candidatus Kariarchaeaceae archaeon]|jgi:hypothetical protein